MSDALIERTAQLIAHRACCSEEHNPAQGKLHGYCVVCGVPWPCEYAGKPPSDQQQVEITEVLSLKDWLADLLVSRAEQRGRQRSSGVRKKKRRY